MANEFLTTQFLTTLGLREFRNECVALRAVTRKYEKEFLTSGAKRGKKIDVRIPSRFEVGEGPHIVPQDTKEESVEVRLQYQHHVPLKINSADYLLSVVEFNRNIIRPAMAQLANHVDGQLHQIMYRKTYNYVGTWNAVPNTLQTYLDAGVALNNMSTPPDRRMGILSPQMHATAANAFSNLFHADSKIFRKGYIGDAAGFALFMSQNVRTHTVGAVAGTPTVNGAGQTGSTIITQAWGALATLNEGDIIDFVGCSQCNLVLRESTGVLQPFRVTANCAADGAGALTIPVDPPIVVTGARQNVTASPTNGGAIRVFGVSAAGAAFANTAAAIRQGLMLHPEAFAFASADLPIYPHEDMARDSDPQVGVAIRLWHQGDIREDERISRMDVLWGADQLRPMFACRMLSPQ